MSDRKAEFNSVPFTRHSEPAIPTSWEEFVKVVASRRSVRIYTPDQVADQDVQDCLDLALLAPSSSNLQPWEFYWIKSPDLKKKLGPMCFDQPAVLTAPVLIACVARTKTWRQMCNQMLEYFSDKNPPKSVMTYYKKLAPFVYNQGPCGLWGYLKKIGFSIVGIFRPVPRGPNSHSEMKLWATKSTALACENLMLAFRAKGYDSCPLEGFDETRVKRALQLPSDASIVMLISAGKRAEHGIYSRRIRFDRNQFIKIIE